MRHPWLRVSLALATVAACAAVPAPANAAPKPSPLAEKLRATVEGLRFQEVLDTAPPASPQAKRLPTVDRERQSTADVRRLAATAAPQPISQQPQLDATVIELDRRGRPVRSGTVLMSPLYPKGVAVPVDRNLSTTSVRWRQWDDKGWYANKGQGTIDVVPGRENAPLDHMLAYPASVLKLMVNFGVLRLVDKGEITLDTVYDYRPDPVSPLCGGATSKPVRQYMDESLTWSSNGASCALIKLLHDRGAIDPLNKTFQDLGLQTLQLKNTNPANGGRWSNAVTMSSLDTAKLLTLINGAPGTVWKAPDGTPVTRDVLSAASRRLFLEKLSQQGFNDMLSSVNRCGADYPAPGIPHKVADRWIGPDGTVTVNGQKFGRDVRPCNAAAEVTFAHKTGWVNNSASDAGIVRSLSKNGRRYVVAVFSNLGTQYVDANRPAVEPGIYPYSYTEKFAKLGNLIDAYERRRAS
ncbi:serine hydrolase [Actinomadura kijaniata]|uniref:serine hydrolase n=1 Tax=Actinomadura kijaniata TaxID=46161 RepID=UPI003F1A517C